MDGGLVIFLSLGFCAGRHSGGSQVEDENAFGVDLGVVEAEGFRQVDAEFLHQPVSAVKKFYLSECVRRIISKQIHFSDRSYRTKGGVMGTSTGLEPIKIFEVQDDPRLSHGVKAFLKVLNSPAPPELEKLTPIGARQVLVDAQAAAKVDYSGIEESEKTIEADGHTVKLNIVRPEGATAKLPVFIFIHGGGWVLGDYPTHKRMVRDLVVETGFAGVFINYTPTPDAVFPTQIEQIYAATKWVAEHGDEINVDGGNLAVVGNSVGGNMTAVTVIKAIENGGPNIKCAVMMWPVANTDNTTESYREFGKDRFLSKALIDWMFSLYIKPEQKDDRYVAIVNTPDETLAKFPPTLIQVAESDVLRDEGEAFGRKLDDAGAEVSTVRYDGMIHDFGLLNGLANEPAVRSLFTHAAAELKKRLA